MEWHRRYLQQAGWTRELREYLFRGAGLSSARRILEVGCGTGAVLLEFMRPASAAAAMPEAVGVDISAAALKECRKHAPTASLAQADGMALPFAADEFDISFCHFLLLWVQQPLQVVQEMKRVTRHGGHVLFLAEPDYTSRTDAPPELADLGRLQTLALQRQGADVAIGARLGGLLQDAGIRVVEAGLVRSWPMGAMSAADEDLEWETLISDVAQILSAVALDRVRRVEARARRHGRALTSVPTYFAWGQV